MTPEQIFAPLAAAIEKQNYTLADVFECIGAAAVSGGAVPAAFAFNLRDYLREPGEQTDSPTQLMAEAYWRTFFRDDTAHKYGTASIFDAGEESMKQFVAYLIGCLSMDKQQNAPGNSDASNPSLFN